MQNIEQFVKERQEIKHLRTYLICLTFPKKIYGVSIIRFALQKTVHVDTRFSTDTGDILYYKNFEKARLKTCPTVARYNDTEHGVERLP